MKRYSFILTAGIALSLFSASLLFSQNRTETKLKQEERALEQAQMELESLAMPEIEVDLSGLEASMRELEFSLQQLESLQLQEFDFDLPAIPEIAVDIPPLPEIDVHIPWIDFVMPEIDIPEIAFDGRIFEREAWSHWGDSSLSEDEQLKISALRAMKRKQSNEVIPAVEKILRNEESAPLRFEAVNLLRYHLDDARSIELLGQAAKSDVNIDVRKRAVNILGRSADARAVTILEEIANR
ncbi:MAG: HEAT repeat domain-containing protein [Candidatus Zhuqueibacterota bacterium]